MGAQKAHQRKNSRPNLQIAKMGRCRESDGERTQSKMGPLPSLDTDEAEQTEAAETVSTCGAWGVPVELFDREWV